MRSLTLPLILLLFAALPAVAQDDKKQTPPEPLGSALPEGILAAVRFTVGGDFMSPQEQTAVFSHPVLLQLSSDKYLHRFDMIVREIRAINAQSLWQFRTIFLFPDMGSFVQWYARPETKTMLGQFKTLGASSVVMKLENIRNPQTVLAPK